MSSAQRVALLAGLVLRRQRRIHARRGAIALALSVLLAACGGGGEGPTSAPLAVPPASCTPKAQILIQMFGDSTQLGYDGATQVFTWGPAIHLQDSMDARFGKGIVSIDLRAVSGTTSQQLITGTDGLNPPWPQEVVGDIVMVNHGINDAQIPTGLEQYRANLRAFAKVNAAVVFQTPTPNWNRAILPDDYAQAMREEAKVLGVTLADSNAYLEAMPGWRNLVPDGIHPTDDGYYRINRDVLAPAVGALVAKLRCAS